MALEKKRGIILQSKTVGEADALITVLSEDGSKQKFIIKGIKKSRKRPIIASEVGSIVHLDYYFHNHSNSVFNVKEINIEKRFDTIKNDYLSTLFLYFFLELMEKTIPEGERESRNFFLLEKALVGLEKSGSNILILPFFKYKLLLGLGVVPKDYYCKKCENKILSEKNAKINFSTLEATCANCETIEEDDIEIVRFFKQITIKSYDTILQDSIPPSLLIKADRILDKFIHSNLGIETKSSEMLYRSLNDFKLV